MKKLIILLLLTIGFVSCSNDRPKTLENSIEHTIYLNNREYNPTIFEFKIDSCQYLMTSSYSNIIHKGDCKYCIGRQLNDTLKH